MVTKEQKPVTKKDDSSRRRKGRKGERFFNVVNLATYTEQNPFSQKNFYWRRFRTKLPRLPTDQDRSAKWIGTLFQPKLLSAFVSSQNQKLMKTLVSLRDGFEMSGEFPTLFILQGPPGSGKTSLITALLSEMCDSMGASFKIDCEKVDTVKMWGRISAFAQGPPSNRNPFKFVLIDSADYIPPTSQQHFKKVFAETEKKTKYIFVCRSASKLTGFVRSKGPQYSTSLVSVKDALALTLRALNQNRIGYNREGIKYMFETMPEVNLREAIEMMQETFIEYHFISEENMEKTYLARNKKRPESTMPASRAIEPVDRCKVCTLFPPCKHITIQDLEAQAAKRRQELPRRRGGLGCYHYIKHGFCRNFNRYGHCSLDHPKGFHKIESEPIRCPQCSLHWPCHHCSFTEQREELIETVERLDHRLELLKQIAVEAPPLALTSHLVDEFPNYPKLLLRLKKTVTFEKEVALKKANEFLDTSTSIDKEEYTMKSRMLKVTLDGLYNSRLLDPPESFAKQEGGTNNEDGDGVSDNESKESSSEDES